MFPCFVQIWMSTDYMAKWCVDNKVLDDLFEAKSTHLELIRRSYTILKLFHDKDLLTLPQLDALWALCSEDKHEAQKHLIYDIVSRLSAHLPRDTLKYLYKRIATKPVRGWDL